nr:GTP-binding protein [uncultured Acetobacterium sp.]
MCNGRQNQKRPTMILFTGFLGSGKTTTLLKAIEILAAAHKKCAIIINEIGDVGIDNRQMRMLGYDVHDLFGGCVCCSMKVTLEVTINYLLEEYEDLDYILFEPSGMANPLSMYPSITNCGYKQTEILNIFIFDPTRIALYEEHMNPLFQDSLDLASCVLVNKIDQVTLSAIETAEKMAIDQNPDSIIFKINLNTALSQGFEQFLLESR